MWAMPSLTLSSASTRSTPTRKVTSHFAGIGSGRGKSDTGWSGQYHANATATPKIAPEAPIIGGTGTSCRNKNDDAAPPIPQSR